MLRIPILVFLILLLGITAACNEAPQPVPVINMDENLKPLQAEYFRGAKALADLLAISPSAPLTFYTEDGAVGDTTASHQVSYSRGRLYLLGHNSPLRGIVLDPPPRRVTDAFHWAVEELDGGNQALVIIIDGLSYDLFSWARAEGLIPNLARGDALPALTVYRPVTNAGLAAMVTGFNPDQSGIHHRGHRQTQVPDILRILTDRGQRGLVIEADINILNLEGQVILNLDRNGDGYIDDEILETALCQTDQGYDYMLVHFHSLDDAGHQFGPRAEETITRLLTLDDYVGQLIAVWPGPVLVISDHGMHQTEEGGNHGEFYSEDMFVPFIIFTWEAES